VHEKTVQVPAISCAHCVATIRRELGDLPGVRAVTADAASKQVTVRYDPPADWGIIVALLKDLGYPPEG
jgi:copper chaperone CopZ